MIGMILGTTTAFGKTNIKPGMNNNQGNAHFEVTMTTGHNAHGMTADNRPDKTPVRPHKHVFNRFDKCHICHMTKHEIHMMEIRMRHNAHVGKPMPAAPKKTSHFGR